MPNIADMFTRVGDLSAPFSPVPVAAVPDAALLDLQRTLGEVRRRVDAQAALVAGEIAHRSRRELGAEGLAARRGLRSAEGLISQLTGGSTRDARTLVKAGELLPPELTGAPVPDAVPGVTTGDTRAAPGWLTLLGDAIGSARLSVEAAGLRGRLAEAGTGTVFDDTERAVFEERRLAAAERLLAAVSALTLEQLAARASAERDELDLAGVRAREEQRRAKRFLKVFPQPDGMTRLSGLLDPESAAIVVPILDAATSPRRGGPRFVDPHAAQRADDMVRDLRSTEQLALDTLVELLRLTARLDDGRLLGERTPMVRILVTRNDLDTTPDTHGTRPGAAFFEGQTEPVSIATAERYICASGAIPILFDTDGRVLNLGRTQRLFSEKQRIALAARDGGCLMCGRPPSWCEAHHIDHWEQHHGRTDIDDGVLLCRFCHLNIHNQHWRIRRDGGDYHLEHPDEHGEPQRTPLPARNPAVHHLLHAAGTG